MRLPRRTFLLGLGGAGVLVTGSILGLRHLASDSNFRSWVEATVARNMPGVAIPETTMAAFSEAFVEQFPPHRMQRILTAGRGAGHAMLEMAGLRAGNKEPDMEPNIFETGPDAMRDAIDERLGPLRQALEALLQQQGRSLDDLARPVALPPR